MNLASYINDIIFFCTPCRDYYANYRLNYIALTCTKDNSSCLKKRIEDNNRSIYCCFEEENQAHHIELKDVSHTELLTEYDQEVRILIFFKECSILRERRD